jgi:hypothetical protein
VEVTPNHYVIRVPRLAGYKTLIVNAVVAVVAVGVALWPSLPWAEWTPEGIAAWYDQMTVLVVGAVALLNMGLRLLATTPAAPFKRTGDRHEDGHPSEAEEMAYKTGYEHGMRQAALNLRAQTVASALADERIAGSDVLTGDWPPLAEVKRDLVRNEQLVHPVAAHTVTLDTARDYTSWKADDGVDRVQVTATPCTWPDCACHIRCEDRRPVMGVPADLDQANGDLASKLAFLDTLTAGAGARVSVFLSAFALPTALLLTGLAAGCAPLPRVFPDICPTGMHYAACVDTQKAR